MTMSGEGSDSAAGLDLSRDARPGVELIGMIGVQPETGTPGARTGVIGGSVDPQYLRRFAQAHEEAEKDIRHRGRNGYAEDQEGRTGTQGSGDIQIGGARVCNA